MEYVDDADDLLALIPDGGHQGGDVLAEALPQGGKGGVVVGVVLVGLGHVEDPGELALGTVLPGLLGAHAHARLGRADDDSGVGGVEGLHDLAGEVKGAGGVQDVDLTAVVLHGDDRGGDGDLALGLLGVVVADGVAVHHRAQTQGAAGLKEHALGQSGLSIATVAQQGDVTDVLRRIVHVTSLLTFIEIPRGAGRWGKDIVLVHYNANMRSWQQKFWGKGQKERHWGRKP